ALPQIGHVIDCLGIEAYPFGVAPRDVPPSPGHCYVSRIFYYNGTVDAAETGVAADVATPPPSKSASVPKSRWGVNRGKGSGTVRYNVRTGPPSTVASMLA